MKNLTILSLSLLISAPAHLAAVEKLDVRDTAAVNIAATQVKADAENVADAAKDVKDSSIQLAKDTADLAKEAAILAKDGAITAGYYAEQQAKEAAFAAQQAATELAYKTEQAAYTVAHKVDTLAEKVDDFATVTSLSAVSQIEQVGSATLQFVDKLLYPTIFTTMGYIAYRKALRPQLPTLHTKIRGFEVAHPSTTVLREVGAGLLTGGLMYATLHGLLTNPKVAGFFKRNMPQTGSLLAHVVRQEDTLIRNTL